MHGVYFEMEATDVTNKFIYMAIIKLCSYISYIYSSYMPMIKEVYANDEAIKLLSMQKVAMGSVVAATEILFYIQRLKFCFRSSDLKVNHNITIKLSNTLFI